MESLIEVLVPGICGKFPPLTLMSDAVTQEPRDQHQHLRPSRPGPRRDQFLPAYQRRASRVGDVPCALAGLWLQSRASNGGMAAPRRQGQDTYSAGLWRTRATRASTTHDHARPASESAPPRHQVRICIQFCSRKHPQLRSRCFPCGGLTHVSSSSSLTHIRQ